MMSLLGLFISTLLLASIEVVGPRIQISNEKAFESKLEVKKLISDAQEAELQETGFIVANTQSSFENNRFVSRWVSLDERTLKNNEIQLAGITPAKGLSYGVVSTAIDFEKDLKTGQIIKVNRYGLKEDRFEGKIIKVLRMKNRDRIQVHFITSHSPELIAGTTTEVIIQHIKQRPFKVSLLSLLHLGLEDFIVIKEKEGLYYPKHATVLEEEADEATILVSASANQEYVARGAILLKPLLTKILEPKESK